MPVIYVPGTCDVVPSRSAADEQVADDSDDDDNDDESSDNCHTRVEQRRTEHRSVLILDLHLDLDLARCCRLPHDILCVTDADPRIVVCCCCKLRLKSLKLRA